MALQKAKSIEAELQTLAGSKGSAINAPTLSLCQKAKLILTNISVEPVIICYILPNAINGLAMQNLNLEKACRVDLGYSENICDALISHNATGYEEQHEVGVQKLVATAMAYKNIVQSLLPAAILLFLGSWSDRNNKRKPCMMIPIMGEIVTITGYIICTYYFYELSMVYNVIAEALPPSLTGGGTSMFMGVFSYISGLSTEETRTLRIGAVNILVNVFFTIGLALSGILYKKMGFYGVFFITLIMYITGFLYAAFRVKELPAQPVEDKNGFILEENQVKPKGFLKDFFDIIHIKETFRAAFKKGTKNRKQRICVIMILVMVIIGPLHGEVNVMYLFVRYKYKWNEIDYSLYSTFNFVAHMIGTLFSLLFFSNYLKLDDAVVGMISSLSKVASCFVYAFAPTPSVFYIGAIVEMFNGTSFIAMRSIISKLVPSDELGKIYALFGLSEALMPLMYGPMYSMIYRQTINTFPGAFFLAGGALTVPSVLIFFWLYTEHKQDEKDELKLKEQEEQDKLLKKTDWDKISESARVDNNH